MTRPPRLGQWQAIGPREYAISSATSTTRGPYRVTLARDGRSAVCTCPAGARGLDCKHARAALAAADSSSKEQPTMTNYNQPGSALAERSTTPAEWAMLQSQAEMVIESGLLPDSIKSPAAALVIMLKGRELGLPPLMALSTIHVIKGKPSLSAEAVAALIYDRHGDGALRVIESTDERCTIAYKRRSWSDYDRLSWTLEQARAADLLREERWRKWPAAMLRARCITAIGKLAFADVLGGFDTSDGAEIVMTPAEIVMTPAEIVMTAQGDLIDAQSGEVIEDDAAELSPAGQMAAAIEIYAGLADKAAELGLEAPIIPDGATLEAVQQLCRDLRDQLVERRRQQRAAG
jgi:hypothetical protein